MTRPSGSWLLPVMIALSLPSTSAQEIEVELYARMLVDHPLEEAGRVDRILSSWLDLVRHEPDHPLAEAALELMRDRRGGLRSPRSFAEKLEGLDGSGLAPGAARALDLLLGTLRAEFLPADQLPEDLFPRFLSRYQVLGPLEPRGNPLAQLHGAVLFADPGFDRLHDGVFGPTPWCPGDRGRATPFVRPETTTYPGSGYAVTAARFDVPEGGPAWLEIDIGDSAFPRSVGDVANPSYAWSLNGAEPILVDHFHEERPAIHRAAVSLRTGRNQLVIRSSVDARVHFAVRILNGEGRPYPGLVEAEDVRPLGAPVDEERVAPRPRGVFPSSEAYLENLPGRGPDTEALLALLKLRDRREAEGLAHLRAAVAKASPLRVGLKALLARFVADARYLPSTWRRNRARELAEEVLRDAPERVDMGLHVASILAEEDREEEAIEILRRLSDAHPDQTPALLALARVYEELEMTAQAEAALFEASERAPEDPAVLAALAEHYRKVGQPSRAIEYGLLHLRAAGATWSRLTELAQQCAESGRVEEAEALYREAIARSGSPYVPRLGELLMRLGRYDEADAVFRGIQEIYPRWSTIYVSRADVARLKGDRETELRHLREAEARSPAWRAPRERIAELAGTGEVRALHERYRADREEVLRAHRDGSHDESVVRVLDSAVVRIFEDGSMETLTHNIVQVRDLEGCERQGTQKLAGDVLKVVTIKAKDGTELEPVRVKGEYVMPSLEPGDFVETIYRESRNAPPDGVVRPGWWKFADMEEPYEWSRYVVVAPRSLGLRLVERHFDGTHETIEEGDDVVHVFESRNRARVLHEAGAPPWPWFLPWVELGVDRDLESSHAMLRAECVPVTRVTPEIREAVAEALDGVEGGDEARARALHAFVHERLDKRRPGARTSATEALLSREGNPTYLYAALLEAAGVPHDVVWTRNVAPESDPEPDPAFIDSAYWRGSLLVRVRPWDGEEAWCDLSSRYLPYGMLIGNAPRAPSYAVVSGEVVRTPEVAIEERPPGIRLDLRLRLDEEGGADVEGALRLAAGRRTR